jgi:hypothetical protein
MSYEDILAQFFPKVLPEDEFIQRTYAALNKLGFTAENTIASACVCRDEITQPLVIKIRDAWGEAFNLSSLGGMFFAGKTALSAGIHHAPNLQSPERYVYYALPHIAISAEGKIGICQRAGRDGDSTACGALHSFREEMCNGKLNLEINKEDLEQVLLKWRLLSEIPYGIVPDLLELTRIAQQVIQKDLECALADIVNPTHSDYAMATGIQIHGPDGNYVAPSAFFAIINGKQNELGV